MNTSMQKTFLIKACSFKEISEGKGALEYLLLDENGNERKVTATAQQGRIKALKNIKAIYKRERPLVKALAKASVDDTVYIDFSKFNKKNPRPNSAKGNKIIRNNDIKHFAYKGYSDFSEVSLLLTDISRLLKLLFISILGVIGILMLKNYI